MPTSPTPDWDVIEAAKLIQSYEEKYGVLIAPGLRSHIAAALRELDRAAEERGLEMAAQWLEQDSWHGLPTIIRSLKSTTRGEPGNG